MPPPSVELVRGRTDWGAGPEYLEVSERGKVGRRDYKVNTSEPELAIRVVGVPRVGQSWSVAEPELRARRVRPEYVGGTDSSETGTGGWTWVRVEYETAGASGRIDPRPIDGTGDFTEFGVSIQKVRVLYDARVGTDPVFNRRLDNGRGADRQVAQLIGRVHRFYPPGVQTPWDEIVAAFDAPINAEPLVLPPERGATSDIVVPPLWAKLVDFDPRVFDGAIGAESAGESGGRGVELVYTLAFARPVNQDVSGHDFIWQQEDPDGEPIATWLSRVDARSEYAHLLQR